MTLTTAVTQDKELEEADRAIEASTYYLSSTTKTWLKFRNTDADKVSMVGERSGDGTINYYCYGSDAIKIKQATKYITTEYRFFDELITVFCLPLQDMDVLENLLEAAGITLIRVY